MLLFTPSLGLFDTFHHGRLGALTVNDGRDGERKFDVSEDRSFLTFEKAWDHFRFQNASDFQNMPIIMVIGLLLSMICLHIFVSSLVIKILNRSHSICQSISQAFYSILTPPLHIDWELFYRQDGNKNVLKSWER